MLHYTLNTNHIYVQEDYKRGIGPLMAPLLDGGNLGLVAKQLSAFRVTVTRCKGGGLFTVWRGQEPLMTCGVALAAAAAAEVWPAVEKLYLDLSDRDPHKLDARHEAKEPASTPWLAVVILPSLAMLTQSDMSWLGDFERCMAWTIAWDVAGQPDEPPDEAKATGKQPGRNDPCPCGSGKKFKKCCLGKASGLRVDGIQDGAEAGPQNGATFRGMIEYTNNGPDIVRTNFWTSGAADDGKFIITCNAGDMRVLLPERYESQVAEMKTGKEVLVTRGTFQGQDALELCFDDNSESPYALHTAIQAADMLPQLGDRFMASVWTRGSGESAVCQLRVPARYRHAARLPHMKPWQPSDETRRLW